MKIKPFTDFFRSGLISKYSKREGICDFSFGNPHEKPLAIVTEVIQKHAVPTSNTHFAYTPNNEKACEEAASALSNRLGVMFEKEDMFLTNGAFAAIHIVLQLLLNEGDEVVFFTPAWFFYESLVVLAGGIPVKIPLSSDQDFGLPFDAIRNAITKRTKIIIVNSPHNPTGRIFSVEELKKLSEILDKVNQARDSKDRIFLLSDESYQRIVFDSIRFHSPSEYYNNTLVIYTFGKSLLIPGQRIGYIGLPNKMDLDLRIYLREILLVAQFLIGFAFPNAILQYGIGELEGAIIDIGHLQQKRDFFVSSLTQLGYQVTIPQGSFYLLVKSPIEDDMKFCEMLGERKILVLPGTIIELRGFFRISLTANVDMIQNAIPGFKDALLSASSEDSHTIQT